MSALVVRLRRQNSKGSFDTVLSLIWDGLNFLDDRAHSIEDDCVGRPVHLCIAGLDGLD